MSKFECGSVARFAAAAGLGLTLALGAAPVVAMAEGAVSAAGSQESTQNAAPGDEGVVPAPEGVAEVNGNSYESLAGAIAAAPDGVQTTVTLVGDIVMKTEDIVTIPAKKNIVLDMAGHKITPSDDFTGRPIVNNGTLTVTGNGTIDVSSAPSGYGSLENNGTMTVENGTFRGNLNANRVNVWNRSSATATFNGGWFDTNGTAVATDAGSTTYINGGHFESPWYPALDNNGKAYLTGGEFVNTSCSTCDAVHWGYTVRSGRNSEDAYLSIDDATVTGTQGGVAVVGGTSSIYGGIFSTVDCAKSHGAVFYALYVAGESSDTAVAVYGGTFSSEKRVAVHVGNSQGDGGKEKEATLSINGGSFSGGGEGKTALAVDGELSYIAICEGTFSSPVPESYCAEGFKPITTPNADGEYVVAKSEDVVKVGENSYNSIQAALDSVKGPAEKTITLTLEADVYENVTIPDGYDVTLDLNGFTLTNDTSDSNALSHTITNNGTLTIVDGSKAKTGTVDNVSHARAAIFNNEGAVADIREGTIKRSKEAGSGPKDDGGNSYYTILNRGRMTLGSGVVVESKLSNEKYSSYSSVIANGWQSPDEHDTNDGVATLIIDGASIEGGLYVKNDSYGVLEMKDGYVKGTSAGIFNYATATISGGTVEAALDNRGAVWNYEEKTYDNEAAPAKLVINGGALNARDKQFAIRQTNAGAGGAAKWGTVEIDGGKINGAIGTGVGGATLSPEQFEITGGTFATNPVSLMDKDDDSVVKINDDGTFTARERKDLPVGTYMVPEGAEKLTAKDFQPGLSITVDENGIVVATKPYVPPVVSGDAVKVEQSAGGTVKVTPSRADEGDEVTITVTPDEGKEVASVTVTDEDGNKVDVKPGEKAGTWTFEMPDGKVTVSVTFRCDGGELCPTHHLSDVEVGAWYHDGADWALSTGLMAGMADGTFAPSTKLSRAQLAVVLWNRAGNPEASDPDAAAAFDDVDPGGFYAGALAWCVETGAFMGLDDTHFDPAGDMTREQLAVVLWRVAGEPESDRDLSAYPDGDTVSAFADTAMRWAVENGVISGQGDGTLDPQGAIDRAQAAVIFQRLAE